jgi:hypothetical protein
VYRAEETASTRWSACSTSALWVAVPPVLQEISCRDCCAFRSAERHGSTWSVFAVPPGSPSRAALMVAMRDMPPGLIVKTAAFARDAASAMESKRSSASARDLGPSRRPERDPRTASAASAPSRVGTRETPSLKRITVLTSGIDAVAKRTQRTAAAKASSSW